MTDVDRSLERDAAFTRLYQEWYGPIRGFLLARVRDEPTAENLTQETFLRAWTAWDTWQQRYDTERRQHWLFAIAANLATDSLRRRTLERRYITPLQEVGRVSLEHEVEMHLLLSATLGGMSPVYRRLLLAQCGTGYTMREIGRRLGKSLVAVKSQLHRAREQARTARLAYEGVSDHGMA